MERKTTTLNFDFGCLGELGASLKGAYFWWRLFLVLALLCALSPSAPLR